MENIIWIFKFPNQENEKRTLRNSSTPNQSYITFIFMRCFYISMYIFFSFLKKEFYAHMFRKYELSVFTIPRQKSSNTITNSNIEDRWNNHNIKIYHKALPMYPTVPTLPRIVSPSGIFTAKPRSDILIWPARDDTKWHKSMLFTLLQAPSRRT